MAPKVSPTGASALTLTLALADARRFTTARRLMACVGLNVSKDPSSGSERWGGISEAGVERRRLN